MKKGYFCFVLVTALILCLSGCVIEAGSKEYQTAAATAAAVPSAGLEPETAAPVSLTDRERLFNSVFTNNFISYDYSTSHSGVYVWLEEYDFGIDKGEALNTGLTNNTGTVVFTITDYTGDSTPKLTLFAGNIKDEASAASDDFPGLKGMGAIFDGVKENVPLSGDTFLGYASFVKDEKASPWLSEGFLKDYRSHLDELKNIDVAYLLMCRFTDIM